MQCFASDGTYKNMKSHWVSLVVIFHSSRRGGIFVVFAHSCKSNVGISGVYFVAMCAVGSRQRRVSLCTQYSCLRARSVCGRSDLLASAFAGGNGRAEFQRNCICAQMLWLICHWKRSQAFWSLSPDISFIVRNNWGIRFLFFLHCWSMINVQCKFCPIYFGAKSETNWLPIFF